MPEISKAQQLAYLTLLNKITAKDDLLKPTIKTKIQEIKQYYGIFED